MVTYVAFFSAAMVSPVEVTDMEFPEVVWRRDAMMGAMILSRHSWRAMKMHSTKEGP